MQLRVQKNLLRCRVYLHSNQMLVDNTPIGNIGVALCWEMIRYDTVGRIEKGEFIAIVGTSGSGKSTLLNMIGGLDRPTSGKITVSGNEVFSMKDDALTVFRRRKIGFVFQNYNLVPVLNVYENTILPIELFGYLC